MTATAKTTDRAVPEWLETPEHEQCEYLLAFQDAEGAQDHSVEMTRAEFDALKRHLAEMRGFEIEGTNAGGSESEPELSDLARTNTERIAASYTNQILGYLEGRVRLTLQNGSTHPGKLTEVLADLAVLHSVITDWDNGGGVALDPGELPMVAAMKANLNV